MPLQSLFLDTDGLRVGNNQLAVSGNSVLISNSIIIGTSTTIYPLGMNNAQFAGSGSISLSANNSPPYWGTGAIDLRVGTSGGRVGITFDSNQNYGSDFGFIYYYDDHPNYSAGTSERGTLIIGVQNDSAGTGPDDQLALESCGHIYLNPGIGQGVAGASSWSQSGGNLYVGNNSVKYLVAHEGYTGAMTMRTSSFTVNGAINAITKSFEIDHPTKPGMTLRYGSLEGPENGVYVRGRLSGTSVIELPDYWTGLVDDSTITVNLTPIGKAQDLYVADVANNTVTVGGTDINCFYTVFAERKDVAKLVVEY